MLYTWVVGYAGQIRPATPETAERLKIEAGKLYEDKKGEGEGISTVKAKLYVRNVGGADVYIADAYLLTLSGEVITHVPTNSITVDNGAANDTPIPVGEVRKVTIDTGKSASDLDMKEGYTYTVKIVTRLGNEFAIDLKLVKEEEE